MAMRLASAARNVAVDAVVDLIDAGPAAGTLKIYSGPQPATADSAASGTLLATFTFSDPAFGAAASGVATAGAIASTTWATNGTAGWARVADSTGATVFDGSVTATGGGGNIELSSTVAVAGASIDVTALTVTAPT